MKKLFMAVCALGLVATPVLAEGFYVAGDVGGIKWASDSLSEKDTAFSIAGGYKFNLPFHDTLALDVSYRDLGSANWDNGLETNKVDITALQFSVIANHSLSDVISFYGRLGYADLEIDASPATNASSSASSEKVFGGVGGHYAINQELGIYLEYNRYEKVGAVKLSAVLVGVDYQF